MDKRNSYLELHSAALRKALQKRIEFFQSLPDGQREQALKFQEFIDLELKKAGNQNNRMSVMDGLMKEYLRELHKQSSLLSNSMKDLLSSLKEVCKEKQDNHS